MTMSRKIKRLKQYIKERAVLEGGEYTLSSGKKTDVYIDLRRVTQQSDSLKLIGELIYDMVKHSSVNAIGGPATGAIPIISSALMAAEYAGDSLNGFWIPRKRKIHGTRRLVEGSLNVGDKVWLFDDVVTTGKSLGDTVEIVRAFYGCEVRAITTIVCRDKKVREMFHRKYNVMYFGMFHLDEITG